MQLSFKTLKYNKKKREIEKEENKIAYRRRRVHETLHIAFFVVDNSLSENILHVISI